MKPCPGAESWNKSWSGNQSSSVYVSHPVSNELTQPFIGLWEAGSSILHLSLANISDRSMDNMKSTVTDHYNSVTNNIQKELTNTLAIDSQREPDIPSLLSG